MNGDKIAVGIAIKYRPNADCFLHVNKVLHNIQVQRARSDIVRAAYEAWKFILMKAPEQRTEKEKYFHQEMPRMEARAFRDKHFYVGLSRSVRGLYDPTAFMPSLPRWETQKTPEQLKAELDEERTKMMRKMMKRHRRLEPPPADEEATAEPAPKIRKDEPAECPDGFD